MGRNINPYESPLTRDEYEYLKSREQQFMIAENERVFGPLGQVEGHEWEPLEEEEDGSEDETEPEEQELSPDGYDPDDVLYVDSLGYGEHQRLLKQMELSAAGDKATVRQRLLDALKERGGVGQVVDLDEDDEEDDEDEDEE